MDGKKFDDVLRSVMTTTSRRATFRGVLAGLAAAATGAVALDSAVAVDAAKCEKVGNSCKKKRGKPKPKCCGSAKCRGGECKCTGNKQECKGECIGKNDCCKNSDCPNGEVCNNKNSCVPDTCNGNGQCGANGACSCTQDPRPTIPGAGKCQANTFTQNFNNNANGWFAFLNANDDTQKTWDSPGTDNTIEVDSGTALIAPVTDNTTELTAATAWGGFSDVFPDGGFETSVDIFLQPDDLVSGEITKFAYSVAINGADVCAFANEFFIHGGGSEESGYCVGFGPDVNDDPCSGTTAGVTLAGFYTFTHEFRDDGGQLAVTRTVVDENGLEILGETLTGLGAIEGFGGNRYGWFPVQDFDPLEIDNSRRQNG